MQPIASTAGPLVRRVGRLALAAAFLAMIVSWTEHFWWIGDLAAHWRPAFAVVLGAGAVWVWQCGSPGWAILQGILVLTSPFYVLAGRAQLEPAGETESGPVLRVFCHNVNGGNRQDEAVLREIERADPDVVVFLEVTAFWAHRLETLEAAYPHHLVEARAGYFGIAVYSRIPFVDPGRIRDYSGYELPSLEVPLRLGEETITLIGTHPPPPLAPFSWRIRNWQLDELASNVARRDEPVVVVGDFNLTPWSAACWRFLRDSGLRKTGVSRRVTWSPFGTRWFGLPIDYQMASGHWRLEERSVGGFAGSDHRSTYTELRLSGSSPRR